MKKTSVILKRLETPDEVREFSNGRFEVVRLGGMTIGRATYQPGWRWSTDVGAAMNKASCVSLHFLGTEAYAKHESRNA